MGEPNQKFDLKEYLEGKNQTRKIKSRTSFIKDILKEAGIALSAKDIKVIYFNTAKEGGREQTINRNVQSTLASLKKRKQVQVDDNGLYFLADS